MVQKDMLRRELKEHLEKKLLPFWQALKDEQEGGFYSFMDFDLRVCREADKGCILNSRILWFFSNAAVVLGDKTLLAYARHAYLFLQEKALDRECGGLYWSLDYRGNVKDGTKHTYNQAFGIYALASYYGACGDREALELALSLFHLIEDKCRDAQGYREAFDRDFMPVSNDKLSENGILAEKTMNTLLHVFEAYTELYRVTQAEEVAESLCRILDMFADKVYNPELGRQEVFFDAQWNSLLDLYSYGHDIESAWLMDRGLEILDREAYSRKLALITKQLTENIYQRAYVGHSVLNEAEKGVQDTSRIWWVQAEALLGFYNAYEKEPSKTEYLQAAADIWEYVKTYLLDKREGGEWFWAADEQGVACHKPIVEEWKCPYHNGRMCIEIIRRTQDVA